MGERKMGSALRMCLYEQKKKPHRTARGKKERGEKESSLLGSVNQIASSAPGG